MAYLLLQFLENQEFFYEVISPDQHQNIKFGVQSSARFGKQSPLSKDDLTYKGTQAITCTYRIYSLIIRSRLRRSGQIFEPEKTFTEPPFVDTGPCQHY